MKINQRYFIGFIHFCIAALFFAVCTGEIAANDTAVYAIKDAKIVTQPGKVIEKGTIVIRNGLIESVGDDVKIPYDAKVIDGSGMTIYPGLIDAGTYKGIPDGEEGGRKTGSGEDRRDIDLSTQIVAATRQVNRKGIYPDYSSARFLKIGDDDAKAWRRFGFTAVHVMPSGELLNGSSTFVSLANPNTTALRDRVLQTDFAMVGGWRSSGRGYPSSRMGTVAHLRQNFLDGQHYQTKWEIYQRVKRGLVRPPLDPAMAALGKNLKRQQPIVFPANDMDDINRAQNLANEFGLDLIVDDARKGFQAIQQLKMTNNPVIVRLNFRKKPELGETSTPRGRGFGNRPPSRPTQNKIDKRIPVARGILEDRVAKWHQEVNNAAALAKAGIPIIFSTNGSESVKKFFEDLRLAVENGLSAKEALTALTIRPAKLFNLENQLGTIESGKIANLVLTDGDLFNKKTKVKFTVVNGEMFDQAEKKGKGQSSRRGKGKGKGKGKGLPKGTEAKKGRGKSSESGDSKGKSEKDEEKIIVADWPIETDASRKPKTKTGGNVVIKNTNVVTAANGTLSNVSILITKGVIKKIGKIDVFPEGHTVIDGSGAWVMPGIIDCHSHMVAGGNEGTLSVTPEVRCADNMRSSDLTLYRAAAGGCTTANVLHGSANTIGGQRIVIQMKYGAQPQNLLFREFAPGIKFALGENVIRNQNRYPNTRMGVESVLRLAFEQARQYKDTWARYNALSQDEKSQVYPPRRDLRLEALVQVLDGDLLVHCHCYNSGEILMLLKTFTRYGIENLTLEHGLEAFKVAPEIMKFGKNGAHLSTFADFWGYKVEAYDAVPYNTAMFAKAGGVAILNSDSGERVRRLNHDAAKMVRWGGMSYQEAIKTVTLNPAIALKIDKKVGSIEVGKKADIAIFNGHPLNTFARCFMTLIDGEVVFERPGERGGPYPLVDKTGVMASTPKISANGTYAIKNAAIFPVTAAPIERGTLIIKDGKIAAMGAGDLAVPEGATVVDGSNLQVYPGLVDGGNTVAVSDLGLSDAGEQGEYKPALEVGTAIKPDSKLIGIARFTGITCSVTMPQGGYIAGQSAVTQMDGWNFDEMTFVNKLALEMTLPSKELGASSARRRRFGFSRTRTEEQPEKPKPELSPYEQVKKMFADAREYVRVKKVAKELSKPAPPFNADFEALAPYVQKQKPVVIGVSNATQILDAIEFAKEMDLRVILRDRGTESWKVSDKIAKAGIPILIGSTTASVRNAYDPYDSVYSLPAKLHKAGVLFAFYSNSNTHARDLPFSAGLAVGFGLPEAEALKAMTSNTAKIFGIDHQVGSLSVGKRADIIITDRSPLQATSNVIHMFIGGKPVDVDNNMHTELYKKYMKRIVK